MPVSSLEIATTAAPYFLTSGSTCLEPLFLTGHRVDQRLALVDGESGFERRDDRGVDRQRHVGDRLHQLHRLARIAGSSASGMPAFTSSMCAPAASCARASASTRLKSPAAISAARILRPVGLMRSPIMTKGRSKPMHDLAGCGADDGVGHEACPVGFGCGSRSGYHGTRPLSTPERAMISATASSWR